MTVNKAELRPRLVISFFIATVAVFSLGHHLLRFWELSVTKQLLLLATALPLITFLVFFLLNRIWNDLRSIDRVRWLLILVPTLALAAFTTWAVFRAPVIWHDLEIIPVPNPASTQVQILEIKSSNGAVIKLSTIEDIRGWVMKDGMLVSEGSSVEPLKLSFRGPIDKPAILTFVTDAQSSHVRVVLDGRRSEFDLANPTGGQRALRVDASFRFGIPGIVIIWLIIVIDILSLTVGFVFLWLIQEIPQAWVFSLQSQNGDLSWSHRNLLFVLLGISFLFHLVNYLSVPLILGADSPTYLQGPVHWLEYHNLEGVSPFRGPVTTAFFLPPLLLFGRNPWGTKLFLHLFALLVVPLSYRLGWQLSKKRWFAFLAGIITVLTPDLYFYSNFVMSEIPNVFLVMLFCTVLLSAIEKLSPQWIVAAMLAGSLTVLLRSENIILLYIGIASLLMVAWLKWQSKESSSSSAVFNASDFYRRLGWIFISVLLAVLPTLGWSAHNARYHGFFGLSNYAGEVLYTGWVYEAEASHIPFADDSSPAIQAIAEAYGDFTGDTPGSQVPTGWKIYPFLLQNGHTGEQALGILREAAIDSIKHDYRVTLNVLLIKIEDSFKPTTAAARTIQLPGERSGESQSNPEYFDEEEFAIPFLILLQRRMYQILNWFYLYIYPAWAWICVAATILCFYRKPFVLWGPISLITMTRVFLPNLIGLSHWRPVVSGLVLMEICALTMVYSILLFFLKPAKAPELEEQVAHPS